MSKLKFSDDKYEYLQASSRIDLRGLSLLADDLQSNVEILKNSYLSIVNSMVILKERRRKKYMDLEMEQGKKSSSSEMASNSCLNAESSSSYPVRSNSDFINSQVARNFKRSGQDFLYCDLKEPGNWCIEKLCDPKTRTQEFDRLFKEVKKRLKNRNFGIDFEILKFFFRRKNLEKRSMV